MSQETPVEEEKTVGVEKDKGEKEKEVEVEVGIGVEIGIKRQAAVFICHGGGPLPYEAKKKGISYEDEMNGFIIKSLDWLAKLIDQYTPRALLIISAHWEETEWTGIYQEKPKLLYDYYGFANEFYQYHYPVSCDLPLTKEMLQLLSQYYSNNSSKEKFIKIKYNQTRGWDHGVFIPLLMARPKADIPIMQLSLLKNLNPSAHLNIGKVLSKLRDKGVMIIGSGMSFHNMQVFMSDKNNHSYERAKIFDNWLHDTLCSDKLSGKEKWDLLCDWEKSAPQKSGRYAHPREEHLLPLHVCLGSSFVHEKLEDNKEIKVESCRGSGMNVPLSCYLFL